MDPSKRLAFLVTACSHVDGVQDTEVVLMDASRSNRPDEASGKWLWLKKEKVPNWVALVSGNMDQDSCGLPPPPPPFHFEPSPNSERSTAVSFTASGCFCQRTAFVIYKSLETARTAVQASA